MAVKTVVGVDVGGSHVTACRADLHTMTIIPGSTCRYTINPAASPEEILDVLSLTVRESLAHATTAELYLGMAMPGPFDYEQGISYINGLGKYESLYGLNVKTMLAERLNIVPAQIRMMNDATAFLLGEVCDNEVLRRQRVAGITLGTGLGSAWYHNDQTYPGALYKLPYLDGMAEDYISTRWFLQQYSGTVSGVRELAGKYSTESEVRDLFTTFGEHLANILLLQFPPGSQDVLIIGGNIARAWHLFIPPMQALLESNGSTMQVLPAQKGEQAPVLGAAALWQ
ncbi:ROK family protein [Pseudoflavitalea sp. X16]|uniref:ROK family protein n=1 Tax=Paraflavitalea devenefica TaxID=2716334 RepID=UPI00141E18C4|nr:ROK family protein [Paraflavitalea devenefica]NII23521.1 ROK family protein [Paraflavitalea devenefica]